MLGAPGQLSPGSVMNVYGNRVHQTPTSNQPLDLHQEISRVTGAMVCICLTEPRQDCLI